MSHGLSSTERHVLEEFRKRKSPGAWYTFREAATICGSIRFQYVMESLTRKSIVRCETDEFGLPMWTLTPYARNKATELMQKQLDRKARPS